MSLENPMAVSGQYETYQDLEGREIIDLSGGFGFQVPEVIGPVLEQTRHMGLSNRVLLSEPLVRLCSTLARLLPAGLDTSYVCSSGAEAFEGALKLCKGLYPNRGSIAFLSGGEYGCLTYGRLMNQPQAYQEMIRFLGVRLIPIQPDTDPANLDLDDCFAICHPYIHRDSSDSTQLVSEAQLTRLYRMAKQHVVPTIGYDVDTCLGTLGSLFGFQRTAMPPDILVLGGALGGGAIPIGVSVSSEEMAYQVYGRSTPAKHGSTTAGNPMSCIAALSALEHIQATDAPRRCNENGLALAAALSGLSARAVGSLTAIPLPVWVDMAQLQQRLYKAGVFVNAPSGAELFLRPPVCARREVLLGAAETIKEVMNHAVTHTV